MGAVIEFPPVRRALRERALRDRGDQATVIILPVVRVERRSEPPDTFTENSKTPSGRKRRRRASQS